MKKFLSTIALAVMAVALVLPASVSAQAQQQPKFKTQEEQNDYTAFFNAAYTEKNVPKGMELARNFLAKYPDSEVAKFASGFILSTMGQEFQTALSSYYQTSDLPRLEKLLTAGNDYLKLQPESPYITAQIALAASRGVLAQFYKDLPKAKDLAQNALKAMESPNPPKDYPADQYLPLRENVQAQSHQFLGYYELEQPTPNLDAAIMHLTESTKVRNKDGLGWKDPNNYWLRASAYERKYAKLSEEYRKLTDEQKTGDQGKALLDQINPLIDKMIDDYARTIAVGSNPDAKSLRDAAKEKIDQLWKYRYSNLPGGQDTLVTHFKTDPLAEAPPRTPSSSTPDAANAPPTQSTSKPTLTSSSAPSSASSTNGSKAATKSTTTTTKKSSGKSKGKKKK
jgi:hypothetical protein